MKNKRNRRFCNRERLRLFNDRFKIFFVLFFLFPAAVCFSQTADSTKQAVYRHIPLDSVKMWIKTLYNNIAGMKITGDVENDFASAMLQYTRAVEPLLVSEINEGKDNSLVALAKRIEKRQSEIIEILRTYIGKVKVSQVKKNISDDVTGSIKHELTNIISAISGLVSEQKLTNQQDDDFSSLINLHALGISRLAGNYLEYGEDEVLMKVVQKMIDENQQDIDIVQSYLKGKGE